MVLVEHFDEAAHVRALEIVRQIDEKIDARRGALGLFVFVENLNRIADVFNADLLQRNGACIWRGLDVYHREIITFINNCPARMQGKSKARIFLKILVRNKNYRR